MLSSVSVSFLLDVKYIGNAFNIYKSYTRFMKIFTRMRFEARDTNNPSGASYLIIHLVVSNRNSDSN